MALITVLCPRCREPYQDDEKMAGDPGRICTSCFTLALDEGPGMDAALEGREEEARA